MNEINTIPIQQFIQLVKAADLSQQREIKMDIKTAKNLMYCISEINNLLISDLYAIMNKGNSTSNDSVTINMDGGNFK